MSGGMAKFSSVMDHPLTRALGGALLALATVMVNDIRSTVAEQKTAIAALQSEVREYKSIATTEDVKLHGRIDLLELKMELEMSKLSQRLGKLDSDWASVGERIQNFLDRQAKKDREWSAYWERFKPRLRDWLRRQQEKPQ